MLPRTRAPAAPVAEGTPAVTPSIVSAPRMAKPNGGCVRGDAVELRSVRALSFELLFEQMPEKAVASAAAAHEDACRLTAMRQKAADRMDDCTRDEMRRGAEKVVQTPAFLAGQLHRLAGEFVAEAVSRQTLGRPALQILLAQPAFQKRLDRASLHGVLAAGVVRLASCRHLPHQGVKQRVARTGLESQQIA